MSLARRRIASNNPRIDGNMSPLETYSIQMPTNP
jgi:hypothetical protein